MAIPVLVIDVVGDLVKGKVVGIEERVIEVVGERERERDTVGERVKGKVVAIPVLVIDVV